MTVLLEWKYISLFCQNRTNATKIVVKALKAFLVPSARVIFVWSMKCWLSSGHSILSSNVTFAEEPFLTAPAEVALRYYPHQTLVSFLPITINKSTDDLFVCFLNMCSHPGWCGSVDWVLGCKPKGHRFHSQSGCMPGLRARSLEGGTWEATTQWCFSPSLSPYLTLCLEINK